MTDASSSSTPQTPHAGLVAGKRVRRRDSLFLVARLRTDGGEPIEVRVRNLSEGGLMAEGAPPAAIGTAVVVELRNLGPVPGKVAWYAENRAGIAFDVAIDPHRARKPVALRQPAAPAPRSFAC